MDKKQALSKAMALCAKQEYCSGDIREKLRTWGIAPDESAGIVKELVRQKFIDDYRYATAYVRDKIRFNQWGRIKIRYMLGAKKIPGEIIDRVFEEISPELYTEVLRDLLQKKDKSLKKEPDPRIHKQKLIRFAISRGFETDEILKMLDK
jgi:regulatory protein